MKSQILFVLALMVITTTAWDLRFLQGWSDPNCAQWSSDGQTCLKCIPRSYNDTESGKCVRVDDNCKTWSETNGQCLTCYDSYGDAWKNGNAINGKCPYYNGQQGGLQGEDGTSNETTSNETIVGQLVDGYDINCKCFDDNKTCIECYEDYEFDSDGICIPIKKTNCKQVQNGVCVECESGFYLISTGECVELPANCLAIDQNDICTRCDQGYMLSSQGKCIVQIQNCVSFSGQGTCLECKEGFFLDTENQCNLLSPNCLSTDNSGQCTECQQGYILIEGNCQIIPDNCNITDENGICTQCVEGYYLTENMECMTLPENCTEATSDGRCISCDDGFFLSAGECVLQAGPNPNCAQQNDAGQCTKCRRFYELKNADCIPTGQNPFCKPGSCECGTGKCLECKRGYFLDINGICTAIAQNCEEYSTLTGSCTSCKQGFVLVEGSCVRQQQIGANLNCREQSSDGNCTSCRKHYKLIDGECVPTGHNPKCKIWNKKKICEYCYYPHKYYLDINNICSEMNPNCAQIDLQTGECTQCDKNYTLEKGKCLEDQINS